MIDAMRATISTVAMTLMLADSAWAAGDAARGEARFQDCAACHKLEAGVNNVGPSLHGIFHAQGRRDRRFPIFAGNEAQRHRLDAGDA
jgi:cytochrome c2